VPHTELQVIKSTVSKSMQACQQQHNNTTYPVLAYYTVAPTTCSYLHKTNLSSLFPQYKFSSIVSVTKMKL